jgi:hypothetical protein
VDEVVSRCVERVRRNVPESVGIFLVGSHARGEAGPFSDIDLDVVVPDGPRDEWPSWLEAVGDRLLRVDTWIRDVATWEAAAEQPQEWAFFLACTEPVRLCWAAGDLREPEHRSERAGEERTAAPNGESWRRRLDRTHATYPPGEPEIGHFQGEIGKLANARGDDLAVRLAAQDLARSVVSLLRPLNPAPPVHSRLAALTCLLGFDVAPAGYRVDMLACLGLDGGGADPYAAACRLASGVLDLLHAHRDVFARLLPDDAAEALRDGTLRRFVEQTLDLPPR